MPGRGSRPVPATPENRPSRKSDDRQANLTAGRDDGMTRGGLVVLATVAAAVIVARRRRRRRRLDVSAGSRPIEAVGTSTAGFVGVAHQRER